VLQEVVIDNELDRITVFVNGSVETQVNCIAIGARFSSEK